MTSSGKGELRTTLGYLLKEVEDIERVDDELLAAAEEARVVFVVSDGMEVDDIETLKTGMAWLSRRAEAVL